MDTWYSGINNFRKYTLITKDNVNYFNTELLDVEVPTGRSMSEAFCDTINESRLGKAVDLLFSGGIDSEFVLNLCLINNIPVRPITMRLHHNGIVVNTHDLYYSEKFCRERNLKHTIIDLNFKKFFDNGDHLGYLKPYKIIIPHVATHMWLMEQVDDFPVLCGDYNWPWTHDHNRVISPLRNGYSNYDRFMKDNGITGIGHMLNHSLEMNLIAIREHLRLMRGDNENRFDMTDGTEIIFLKNHIYQNLSGVPLDVRFRSFGWEYIHTRFHDRTTIMANLVKEYGTFKESITWGQKVADVLGGSPGTWNKF